MLVEASSISARIGARDVLCDVNMSVRGGELLALVGPNGAGKTTLLRVLAGLQEPSAGCVNYDECSVHAMPAGERARSVSYLAQDNTVSWPLRVSALVALGRLPHRGASATDNEQAVRHALAATDSTDLAERSIGTLSGGERARVLLARALAVGAPVLLADEPVAALDPYHQLQIMEVLRASVAQGNAVVAVFHDLALAYRFSDRVVLLSNGAKMADGTPDDVLTDANLAAYFGVTARRGEGYIVPWQRQRSGG